MPDYPIFPRIPHKQIELWDITSSSGNFRPYQIQTANIHFKELKMYVESYRQGFTKMNDYQICQNVTLYFKENGVWSVFP